MPQGTTPALSCCTPAACFCAALVTSSAISLFTRFPLYLCISHLRSTYVAAGGTTQNTAAWVSLCAEQRQLISCQWQSSQQQNWPEGTMCWACCQGTLCSSAMQEGLELAMLEAWPQHYHSMCTLCASASHMYNKVSNQGGSDIPMALPAHKAIHFLPHLNRAAAQFNF